MIKKVKVENLKPGMFVSNFNCDWLNHPFFTNSKKVKDQEFIEKVLSHGIKEVFIDTDKGIDVIDERGVKAGPEVEKQKSTVAVVDKEKEKVVPIQNELDSARVIKKEAANTIKAMMDDVIKGEEIKVETAAPVVDKMIGSVMRNHDALVSLGRIRKADEYTFNHSLSVCTLMLAFGKALGFSPEIMRELGVGALLHDIGKMKVSQAILNKKGKLSPQEFEMIKLHVTYGHEMLKESGEVSDIALLVTLQHHERLDGSGYPHGLKGDEISIYGQAIAIADVYDAITSERGYSNRVSPTFALKKLLQWSENKFHPELVQKFVKCVGVYPVGTVVRLESGLLGLVLRTGKKGVLHPVVRIVYNTRKEKFILPYDIDLSDYDGNGSGKSDKIISCEMADDWNINPQMYL